MVSDLRHGLRSWGSQLSQGNTRSALFNTNCEPSIMYPYLGREGKKLQQELRLGLAGVQTYQQN